MNLKVSGLYRFCVQVTLVSLAACGASPQRDNVADSEVAGQSNYYLGSAEVFGVLISGSGGSWIFDEVTDSSTPPEKGYLVRLNDLAPAFDTRITECTPQAYPANHRCNPAHPFRSRNIGVVDKIISGSIAAGTGGKVTDVSRTYETSFDEATFNQAVDEALINSGLDQKRREFLEALESYAVLLETSSAKLSELRGAAEAEYRDTRAVQLDIQPRLSGLTEYYTDDLNFRELIDLVPKSFKILDGVTLQGEKLLPCDARVCVRRVSSAIEAIRSQLEKSERQLQANSSYDYEVRCNKTRQSGYLFQLDCPKNVTWIDRVPVTFPLSMNILARNFDNLYPNMELGDDHLAVVIDSGVVTFYNLTSAYLSVSAQTVYYNSRAQTNAREISLAPGVIVKHKMSEFLSPVIEIESSYHQMTPDKAKNSTFEFGFAVKYRKADDDAELTLYDKREFNVGCVIDNRIRPGSCDELPLEETDTEEGATAPT